MNNGESINETTNHSNNHNNDDSTPYFVQRSTQLSSSSTISKDSNTLSAPKFNLTRLILQVLLNIIQRNSTILNTSQKHNIIDSTELMFLPTTAEKNHS